MFREGRVFLKAGFVGTLKHESNMTAVYQKWLPCAITFEKGYKFASVDKAKHSSLLTKCLMPNKSKNHIFFGPESSKSIRFFRPKSLKNHILKGCTCLNGPFRENPRGNVTRYENRTKRLTYSMPRPREFYRLGQDILVHLQN